MKTPRSVLSLGLSPGLPVALSAAALFLGVAGCSGGSSSVDSSTSGPMFVDTCSLGCSSGAGGNQVSCSTVATSVNNEISVYFSQPVAENSVSSSTFQLIDVNTGQVPVGQRLVDPFNPRRVIFRPSVTFDASGNPSFGFDEDTTYRITIKGQGQGDNPPYITSQGGKANRSRMVCDIQTSQGIIDIVAGPPTFQVFVDLAIPGTPDPNDRVPLQPASGATNVWRSTKITLAFNDVMNPVTLINQATQQATFITIFIDPDGNLSTTNDQVPLLGTYALSPDPSNLRTLLIFTSPSGMPSGGAAQNRLVVVNVPTNVQDLAGNSVANAGSIAFTPETVAQGAVTLPDADGEDFDDLSNNNISETSADWGGGQLTRGTGGGSGRLGRLYVRSGTLVTIDTDSTVFPLAGTARDLLDNAVHGIDYDPLVPASWPTITITDGIFEFTSITVESGGTLAFAGSRAARVLCRGPFEVAGTIDISGTTPVAFDSATALGQAGGAGGPGGGDGGDGGDRPDYSSSPLPTGLLSLGAIANPGADTNGQPSQGIDGQVGGLGAASGGLHFPFDYPTGPNTSPPTIGQVRFADPGNDTCVVFMVANGGGGGGYALNGSNAVPNTSIATASDATPNLPVQVAGDFDGDGGPGGTALGIEPADPESGHVIRRLDANFGNLRGGAGGGGGGSSLFGSRNDTFPPNCLTVGSRFTNPFQDHSAAGGGGGGGALQLVSGRTLHVGGLINARGGNGGSAVVNPLGAGDRNRRATPGGGGAGGAVRLQGSIVAIDPVPIPGTSGRIDVRGGVGGGTDYCFTTTGACSFRSLGGAGSMGLIRIEDGTGLLTRASEAPKLLPFSVGDLESRDWLSVATWQLPRRRPESFTAAVSCWMRPSGNFFEVLFAEDDLGAVNPDERYGWNMEVMYDDGGPGGLRAINYRGPDPDSPFGSDLETLLKNNLNYNLPVGERSYFCVRFQGARLRTDFAGSLCDVNINANEGNLDIVDSTLTPWVRHPSDLNDFNPKPTMIRFTIVFDTTLEVPGTPPDFIQGLRALKIRARPD